MVLPWAVMILGLSSFVLGVCICEWLVMNMLERSKGSWGTVMESSIWLLGHTVEAIQEAERLRNMKNTMKKCIKRFNIFPFLLAKAFVSEEKSYRRLKNKLIKYRWRLMCFLIPHLQKLTRQNDFPCFIAIVKWRDWRRRNYLVIEAGLFLNSLDEGKILNWIIMSFSLVH